MLYVFAVMVLLASLMELNKVVLSAPFYFVCIFMACCRGYVNPKLAARSVTYMLECWPELMT